MRKNNMKHSLFIAATIALIFFATAFVIMFAWNFTIAIPSASGAFMSYPTAMIITAIAGVVIVICAHITPKATNN